MTSTRLEQTRQVHERIERLESTVCDVLWNPPKSQKDDIIESHRILSYLESIKNEAEKLQHTYRDEDGFKKEEIESISGTGPTLFSNFYDRIREIKEYHRRFPNVAPEDPYADLDFLSEPSFTGEESTGRFLDLHENFNEWINLNGFNDKNKTDYVDYLENFFQFSPSPSSRIFNESYWNYLNTLFSYLCSFFDRSFPLFSYTKYIAEELKPTFDEQWNSESSNYAPWKSYKIGADPEQTYCEACRRVFAKATVFHSHLAGKKHQMNWKKLQNRIKPETRTPELAFLEYKINQFGKLLEAHISETIDNIVKKQARTAREIEAELEVVEEEEESEDEEEEETKMTIENYPVGWDGKPIPYWLYKLHGLGVEYKCEICGNQSYWGRKAFERHFQEWRHAHGMACLQIPNTRHFQEITKINDAVLLYKKIKADSQTKNWKPEQDEELEDQDGNVFSKKVYDDLVRQGIIDQN